MRGTRNVSASWGQVFDRFPDARVISFSATPTRADGQLMEGEVIYSFPVVRAIQEGYVKRLSAKMLRPSELVYVDKSSGTERTIELKEVIELGQRDAEFRRGIVQSDGVFIVQLSFGAIGELRRLRQGNWRAAPQDHRFSREYRSLHPDHRSLSSTWSQCRLRSFDRRETSE